MSSIDQNYKKENTDKIYIEQQQQLIYIFCGVFFLVIIFILQFIAVIREHVHESFSFLLLIIRFFVFGTQFVLNLSWIVECNQ